VRDQAVINITNDDRESIKV